MRKLIIILSFAVSINASAQQISVDSLASVIRTMQAQIAELEKKDTIAYAPGQVTVTVNNPKKQTVSINNYAAMNSSATVAAKASTDVAALTTQLTAATVRITALETKVTALQAKVAALKVISTTTSTIQ